METERLIAEIEALRVAPDERLLLRIPSAYAEFIPEILDQFDRIGIADRVLVFAQDEPLDATIVKT